jgi:hypothetical protein
VISPALFSMMVAMALITTFMATPLLEWFCPNRILQLELTKLPAQDVPSATSVMESTGGSAA